MHISLLYLPETTGGSFDVDAPITGAEAAAMLQNALDLSISQETLEIMETDATAKEEVPAWAAVSLTAMAEYGIDLSDTETLSRGDMAQVMYQVSHLAPDAVGMTVIRKR